jgi:hypothetical protein
MFLKLTRTKVIYNALQKAIQLFSFQIWQQNITEVFWQVLLNTIKETKVNKKIYNNFCHALQQVTMETILYSSSDDIKHSCPILLSGTTSHLPRQAHTIAAFHFV